MVLCWKPHFIFTYQTIPLYHTKGGCGGPENIEHSILLSKKLMFTSPLDRMLADFFFIFFFILHRYLALAYLVGLRSQVGPAPTLFLVVCSFRVICT